MQTTFTKFIVGQSYGSRSACDSDCIFSMEIVSRTEKTATVKEHDKVRRYKIHNYDGVESISRGNYSMAGSWYADRPLLEETEEQEADDLETVLPANCIPFRKVA